MRRYKRQPSVRMSIPKCNTPIATAASLRPKKKTLRVRMFDQFSRRFSTCKKIHIQQTSKSIEHVYMCTNTKIAKENKIERGRRELIFIGRTGGNEIIHSLFELFCCCRHRHCWWWWLLLLFAFPQVPCTRDSISVGCDSHSSQSLFVLIV